MVVVGVGNEVWGVLPVLVSHLHADDWNEYLNEDDLVEDTDTPE